MAVREGLLALLDRGPSHGYGLKSEFERATGGVWPLNVGQVYTTIDRLERDGLVEPVETVDEQRAWQLTDQGREAIGEWWWAVPGEEPPPRDELVLKVLLAVNAGHDQALEVIARQRDALLTLLAKRRKQAKARAHPRANALAAELMVDVLVYRAEADVRWLDLCEARISESNRQSPIASSATTADRPHGEGPQVNRPTPPARRKRGAKR